MNNSDSIRNYHRQTKHRLDGYAKGPETIDWDSQPNPFRYYENTSTISLPLSAGEHKVRYSDLWRDDVKEAQALTLANIGSFFELALGLSAWKVYGTAKWSVRCNPSSGNLHPTEAYVLLSALDGVAPGLYHYCPREHQLERRATFNGSQSPPSNGFVIGLSSVAWREAWKYGERAFRYCQLDTGHAIMAIRVAAACLGWNVTLLNAEADDVDRLLGLERESDFQSDEKEYGEVLLHVSCDHDAMPFEQSKMHDAIRKLNWTGKANRLDRHHFYEWPIIEQAFDASHSFAPLESFSNTTPRSLAHFKNNDAVDVIKTRRSATAFNPRVTMPQTDFYRIVDSLLPRTTQAPWDVYPFRPRIHLVLYIHRVEDMKPGLYAFVRDPDKLQLLKNNMRSEFAWENVPDAPVDLPFYRLLNANTQRAARTLSCHQDIASDSAFCVSMLAEYDDLLAQSSGNYRHLHWEAGMLGQLLYVEAEAAEFRGTGIGCFFDDAVHEVLGITNETFQVVYHFTVGDPIVDHRIASLPAYQRGNQ